MDTTATMRLAMAVLLAAVLLGACQTEQKAQLEHEEVGQVIIESSNEPSQQTSTVTATQAPITDAIKGKVSDAAPKRELAASEGMMGRVAKFASAPPAAIRFPSEPLDRENYAHFDNNPVKLVAEQPVSTFSIDVDTGAYANVRRMLNEGRLPPQDAVRVEEMINYFSYNYQPPKSRRQPFSVTAEMGPAPWSDQKHLLHIGIKGYEMDKGQLPPANLVFLVDVSGSMQSSNKLPLLKDALKALTQQLSSRDRVSLVVYAGASGVVLEPTPGNQHGRIAAALDGLYAGGSTNGGAGIRLAYAMAESAFIQGGINRVILATDGDFNVGTVNFEALVDLVEQKRKTGISLTTLGFGAGNYNDHLMEQLADKGNGNHAYIDTLNEARKVLVDEIGSTLMTIAKDVKIQIEFNSKVVAEYRLIGYENRMLKREDFNNDNIDAGDIGAGHTVTALYEFTLVGKKGLMDPLRYGKDRSGASGKRGEIAFLRLRYKQPDSDTSRLIEHPLRRSMIKQALASTTERFRYSASVAAFGDLLRGGAYSQAFSYDDVLQLVRNARSDDANGYKREFTDLVQAARNLDTRQHGDRPWAQPDGDGLIID